MSDPATFHQILSNVALSISIVRGQGVALDNPIAVAHNLLAVRAVNNRLSHPVEGISDSTMTSVLSLTCHSVSNAQSQLPQLSETNLVVGLTTNRQSRVISKHGTSTSKASRT